MFRSASWTDSENKVSKGSVWDGDLGDQGGGKPGPADRTFTAASLRREQNRGPHRTREYAAVPPRSAPKAEREADCGKTDWESQQAEATRARKTVQNRGREGLRKRASQRCSIPGFYRRNSNVSGIPAGASAPREISSLSFNFHFTFMD